MMKRLVFAALTGLCLSLPAHAQMTDASCATSWALLSGPLGVSPDLSLPVLEGPACVARNIEAMNGRMRVLVDELRWQFDGFAALLASGTLLDRAEIGARGIYVLASTGLPDFDYALEAQARAFGGIDVDLVATHVAGEVRLERFHVDFPGENSIDATLHMAGVDPQAPENAVVHAMQIEVLTNGLFESYALMPLANLLLAASEDPEAEVARLQTEAIATIDALPVPLFDRPSRRALAMIVQDMPNPAGTVTFALQSHNGVLVGALAAQTGQVALADPLALLAGAEVRIGYQRGDEVE